MLVPKLAKTHRVGPELVRSDSASERVANAASRRNVGFDELTGSISSWERTASTMSISTNGLVGLLLVIFLILGIVYFARRT